MGLLLGMLLAACGQQRSHEPVRLRVGVRAGESILSAVPAAGYRINGRVSPALESPTGQVILLNKGRRSPDSTYFVDPPWARVPKGTHFRGTLRASVCRTDEALCRIAVVAVDLHQ